MNARTIEAPLKVADSSDYQFWRAALDGKPMPVHEGEPRSGYYRTKRAKKDGGGWGKPVAIWRDEEGWNALRGDTACEAGDIWAYVCRNPISYDLYEAVCAGAPWPDAIEIEAAPDFEADVPAETAISADLTRTQEAARKWLIDLGHPPATQVEADKAGNFADAFSKIEKAATAAHKAGKEPHLEASRAVDRKFFPIRDAAAVAKTWAKGLSEAYAKAETDSRSEEARAANEKARHEYAQQKALADAQAKRDAQLAALGVAAPAFAPAVAMPQEIVAAPVKIGSGARRQSLVSRDVYAIENMRAALLFLSDRNEHSADFREAALKECQRLCKAGVTVPGVIKTIEESIR